MSRIAKRRLKIMRKNKWGVFLIMLLLAGCAMWTSTDDAVALMEKGKFEEAMPVLERNCAREAKACYAYAVCMVRKNEPDVERALQYRAIAQKMGYTIPQWFDDYAAKIKGNR
jgi:hypothetical protein